MTESRMKEVAREMMEGMNRNFTVEDLKMLMSEVNDQIEHLKQNMKRENDQLKYLKQALGETNDKCVEAIDMANYLLSMIDEYQKEDRCVSLKARDVLDKCVPVDADVNLEDCREMFNRVEDG